MFRYKLESLLNHRKYLEDVIQKELASITRILKAEKKKLMEYKENEKSCQIKLGEKQQGTHSPTEIIIYQKFLIKIASEIEEQEKKVINVQQEHDLKHRDLVNAVKKRKTLEKLKDKELRKHMQKELKKEQDFMNEVAGNQFRRKKNPIKN